MSALDWEEVKRLAADFQRAQLSSSIQRLSERNCIEIINKLIESKQVEVIFTSDGKEYITPQHLVKEIKDELYVHGGRINLVDLAKILSVDLSVISARASDVERLDAHVRIINGQLIDQSYILTLCEEINERLNQQGQITIGDLTGQYDLPTEFLLSVVEKQLGKLIKGRQDKQDRHVFFTEDFVERNTSIARGALLSVTKPTSVATIINACGVQERLFFSVIEVLIENKEMPGVITGKQGVNSMYVPSIYIKSQTEWVNNFYEQNGYLEYSALTRLGISDPVSFIKRHFSNALITMLESCAVGPLLFEQVECAIEDIISTGALVNILPILPSVFEEKDVEVIIHQVLKKKSSSQNLHIFNSTIVATDYYLRNLTKLFDSVIEKNAQNCVTSGTYIKTVVGQDKIQNTRNIDDDKFETKADRKEERRKKAGEGKAGGGTQGRETKTKSTKKKYMKSTQNDDSDEDKIVMKNVKQNAKLEIVRLKEIQDILNSVELLREEESEELIQEIAQYLHPLLNKKGLEAAKSFYESTIATTNQDRRKKHSELQEKLNDLVLKVRLFEKGLKQFNAKDVQQQLAKYLLKTVCTDITNDVFAYVAQSNMQQEGKEMTTEVRVKILNDAPNDVKETLLTLHKSLTSATLDDFLNIIEVAVGPGLCDVVLKKPDKKKEKPQLLNHRQQLIEQLNVSDDPALVLHLASLIVFQGATQTMLHASGRFVSNILTFLQPSLSAEVFNSLQRYHDLVLRLLTASDSAEKSEAQVLLLQEMPGVKEIALSFKKNAEKSRRPSD